MERTETLIRAGGVNTMTTLEVTTNQQTFYTLNRIEPQKREPIARYQTGKGLTALVVIIMDLLVKLDPR